jgi:hypothetical protein
MAEPILSGFETQGHSENPESEGNEFPDLTAPPKVIYYGEYDQNGVDLSLLRYMLQLTPLERLTLMEKHAQDTEILYEHGRKHRESKASSGR